MSTEAVLEALLEEVEGALAPAEYDLRLLEDHVRQLQAERYGLQVALARVRARPEEPQPVAAGQGRPWTDSDDAPAPPPSPVRPRPASWAALSRAEAVEAVLADAEGPLTRLEVVERLAAAGRDTDDADAVSAALAYLLRSGRATRAGRGQWARA